MTVIKPQFKLKDPKSEEPSSIYLRTYYNKKRFTYYIGVKILPKYWDPLRQKPMLSHKDYPGGRLPDGVLSDNQDIDFKLKEYSAALLTAFKKFTYEKIIPSTAQLAKELDKVFRVEDEQVYSEYLVEYIDGFMNRTNNKPYTQRNYKTTRNHIEAFEKEKGKRHKILEVDLDFYDELIKYFYSLKSSTNTIGTHVKNLKVFLADAEDRGIAVNPDYRKKRFKVVEEQSDSIYLTVDEVAKLRDLDLSDVPYLDRIRDLFLVGCFTGLRFSDYDKVTRSHIQTTKKGQLLKVRMTKTGKTVAIPVMPELNQLLEKYGDQLPRVPTNQKMNFYIKQIAKKAKINEKVAVSISKGNLVVEEAKPKYKLISTHTARRSFATNAYISGMSTLFLRSVTGHKTDKSFYKYIRISQEEDAILLLDHPFFRGHMRVVK